MLKLYVRHDATGITVDCPNTEQKTATWDMRDATMALVDKVAETKNMSPMEVMANSGSISIVAIWDVGAAD